ncbi:MAG: hypothetical protein IJA72_05115 [Clostridia bacterium]|nr:hypothetical protein [Clostridia bacterium]
MYYDNLEGLPIDWNPYSRNESAGRMAYVEAESLYGKGQLEKARAKYKIARDRYMSCANFLRAYKQGENPDINRNIKRAEDGIAKCQSRISSQSRVV